MTDKKASTPKAWNGKPVWTEDTCDHAVAVIGDYYAVTSTAFSRT